MEREIIIDKLKEILAAPGRRTQGMKFDAIYQELIGSPTLFSDDENKTSKDDVLKIIKSECRRTDGAFVQVKKKGHSVPNTYKLTPPKTPGPKPATISGDVNDTGFIGRAGEYAVMSELLFRGYNTNSMVVDKGIDVIASNSDNKFFFIQVKTTHLSENRTATVSIKRESYLRSLGNDVRYIVVIRCGRGELRFFVFNQQNIEMYSQQGYINTTDENINIKIEFDIDNKPYLYHEKKKIEVSFFQNNFNL